MIMPSEVIEIGSSTTGLIDAVMVERGDYVEVGEVVAKLESSVEQAAVRVARARAHRRDELDSSKVSLELEEKRRQRAVNLFERNSLSLDSRQEVETEANLAALELERAKENNRIASLQLDQAMAVLRRHTIRSPISGFVTERLMAPGEVVDEETILRIAQVDPLRVEVILPSQWFGRVHPGDRAEIVPEAPLDEARSAEVAIVDPLIDGPSGTFGVRLLLPNPDHDLPAGLRCQVSFLDDD
jgi:RND family efflux transporter MFP subunit